MLVPLILFAASRLLAQYSLTEEIVPGVIFHKLELPGPIAVQYLEVDLKEADIAVETALAHDALGNGGERVSELCERLNNEGFGIVAAINGDFFGKEPPRILNSMISKGEFVKCTDRLKSQFGLLKSNRPIIEKISFNGTALLPDTAITVNYLNDRRQGKASLYNRYYNKLLPSEAPVNWFLLKLLSPPAVNDTAYCLISEVNEAAFRDTLKEDEYLIAYLGKEVIDNFASPRDTVKIIMGTLPDVGAIEELVGGLPRLIIDGRAIEEFIGVEGLKSDWFVGKNPRTAVGFNADSTILFLVTVDGRQTNYSVGMSLNELADFMINIGCYQAVNLDGGGSTTMWVNGKLQNSPSDKTGERPVHNALIVRVRSGLR